MSGKNKTSAAGNGNIGEQLLRTLTEVQRTGRSSVVKAKTEASKPAEKNPTVRKASAKRKAVPARKETGAAKKTETVASDLTFKVDAVAAPVDAAALQAEAKQRSEQLFGSAAEYFENDRIVKELLAIPNIGLTNRGAELEKRMAEKKKFDAMLSKQPQGVRDQFNTDLVIVRIKKAAPTADRDVIAVIDEIEKMGRGHKPANEAELAKVPKDQRLFFIDDKGDKHHLLHNLSQMPGREGQVSGADKLIFSAVRGMIWRFSQYQLEKKQLEDAAMKSRVEEIRAQRGDDPRNFMQKKVGTYVFYLPSKEVSGKPVGMPGAAKMEVYAFGPETARKIGLRILEGAGCLAPRWEAHERHGYTMPFWWLEHYVSYHQRLKKAREKNEDEKAVTEFPDTIPGEMRGPVQSFLRKLTAAADQAKKVAWRTAKEQQPEQPKEQYVDGDVHAATELAETPEPELAGAHT